MKRRLLALLVIGSVAVTLTGGSALAHPSGLPADDAPGKAQALAPPPTPGPVASRISFQGVLEEGGYEGGGAMLYTTFPGPFEASVEDRVISKVKELAARVRN